MKVVYNKLNTAFELKNDKLNFLVIEDCRYFEDFVISAYEQIKKKNEKLSFYINNKEETMHKYADIICSPIDITYDKKEIQKKLVEMLIREIQMNDIELKFVNSHSAIVDAFEKVQEISDFEIEFNDDFDLNQIIKDYDIKLKEPEGFFVEKLLEYMDTVYKLINKEVFILINCSSYLSNEDYLHIGKWAAYQGVYVLFVNNYQLKLNIDVNEYIIDIDLCLLH